MPVQIAAAERTEESTAWRNPVDLVALLDDAFVQLGEALETGHDARGGWTGRSALVELVLGDDPGAGIDALLDALRGGASEVELASAVSFAAATRIARFRRPTSSATGTRLSTPSRSRTRSSRVFGAQRRPSCCAASSTRPRACTSTASWTFPPRGSRLRDRSTGRTRSCSRLPALLDRQQQVDEAGELVASYLAADGEPRRLVAALGSALVRENRNFHTIQWVEAAVRQHELLSGEEAALPLVAAARYLAAHATTTRSQRQTFDIARRLHRGEKLYEEAA